MLAKDVVGVLAAGLGVHVGVDGGLPVGERLLLGVERGARIPRVGVFVVELEQAGVGAKAVLERDVVAVGGQLGGALDLAQRVGVEARLEAKASLVRSLVRNSCASAVKKPA